MSDTQELMDIPEDESGYFNIDWNNRQITVPDEITCIGVYNDKDTNRIYFRCKVNYGTYRVADFGIRVNYVNTGLSGQQYDGDVYFVDDAEVDGDYMTFSWLVGRRAYLEAGSTAFIVCCKIVDDDDNVLNELNTTVTTLPVLDGIEVDAQPEEDYPDYLEELLKMVDSSIQHITVNNVEQPVVDKTVNLSIDRAYCEDKTLVLSDVWDTEAIECIMVQGVAQEVTNHTVDLTVATTAQMDEANENIEEASQKISDLETQVEELNGETLIGVTVNNAEATIVDRIANIELDGVGGVAFATYSNDDPTQQVKSVTCNGITSIYDGVAICVTCLYASTAAYPKLEVNSLGAYDIVMDVYGGTEPDNVYWSPRTTMLFVFMHSGWYPVCSLQCGYGRCTSSSDNPNKSINASSFVIWHGTILTVLFENGNTAEDVVLSWNSGGGSFNVVGDTNWEAGEYVDFVFDGESWVRR